MKIFIINNFSHHQQIGGSEIQCWLIAKYLTKLGHTASYLAVENLEEHKIMKTLKHESKDGFSIIYLKGKSQSKFKALVNFYKRLKSEKPDVCYTRIFKYLFFFRLICGFLKIPLVFNTSNIRDCQPDLARRKGWSLKPKLSFRYLKSLRINLLRYLNFNSLKKVKVITINKHHARLLKSKYYIEAIPIYNSMEDNYQDNITTKDKQVVWINAIKERKQPEFFIQLTQELKNTGYKFIMIGKLQNKIEEYKKMVDVCKKENPNFEYLGEIKPEEVDKILAKSQIFINTCLPEGFGNNFIQAWLNECPSVSLSFDADDIAVNNQIGYHSKTFEQMVKDVKTLMQDNNLRTQMGQRARTYALQNHSILSNIKRYQTVFQDVVSNN